MFGSSGEDGERSDELKEDGELVLVSARNQSLSPRPPGPLPFRRSMCHVRKRRGALAEAQSSPASYELVTLNMELCDFIFFPILVNSGESGGGAGESNHWTREIVPI